MILPADKQGMTLQTKSGLTEPASHRPYFLDAIEYHEVG